MIALLIILNQIINNYKSIDKRIKIIKNSKNLGLTKSLILGINASSSEYLARIDADEYAKPSRLEKQYTLMRSKKILFYVDLNV